METSVDYARYWLLVLFEEKARRTLLEGAAWPMLTRFPEPGDKRFPTPAIDAVYSQSSRNALWSPYAMSQFVVVGLFEEVEGGWRITPAGREIIADW